MFAYDEARNLADHAAVGEFPVSLLLDAFSYLQRLSDDCHLLLILTGLPTLFPKLNEARTYTERMFHVLHLQPLNDTDARAAIVKPIEISKSPLRFAETTITKIIELSSGYPYFVRFACKEVFDAWIGKLEDNLAPSVPVDEIIEKLDQDFFAPRWQRTTDRQQDFMRVISTLESNEAEFSIQEITKASRAILKKGFSASHTAQMLQVLAENGLIYRARRGGHAFAVPLLAQFIRRQTWNPSNRPQPPPLS